MTSTAMSQSEEQVRKAAAKAMEVFETVELMEQILLHVDARDVLHAMCATKCMRDTVNGSTKIQKKIGLLPDKDSHFRLPLWPGYDILEPLYCFDNMLGSRFHRSLYSKNDSNQHFHGLRLKDYSGQLNSAYDSRFDDLLTGEPPPDICKDASFMLVCEPKTPCLLKMGSRIDALSPCQPPLPMLTTVFYCRNCGDNGNSCWELREGADVKPSNGQYVTLGDTRRTLVTVRREHRAECKEAKAKSGVTVEFKGRVKLRRDDLVRVARREETIEWEKMNGSRDRYRYPDSEDEG